MDIVGLGDGDNLLHLDVGHVVGGGVAVGAGGAADGTEANGLDAVGHHIVVQLGLLEAGVQLHLNEGGLDPAQGQHGLQLGDGHAGHAQVFHQAHVVQALHLPPGGHKVLHLKGAGIGVAGIAVTPGGVIVGEGPVDKVGVQVVQLQVLQGLGQRQQHVALPVHVVPHLGGDEQLLPLDNALLEGLGEHLANLVLVAIDRGAVKQAVAAADGARHSGGNLLGGKAVRAKGAHADAGDLLAVQQSALGYFLGVNPCHGISFFLW